MAFDHVTTAMLVNAAFLLSTVSVIIMAMNYIIIQTRRASFLFETKMEQARLEAEQADRAKSAFLATMSHEVRTPLNGILGIANLLEDTRMDGLQRGFVETIKYSGETLLAMLNEILDFSKLDAGKMSLEMIDFDLNRLVKSVTDLMQSRASEKGLLIEYDIRGDTPAYVSSDPTRLRQVLLNLTNNAIKFTERGKIAIRVRPVLEEGWDARLRFEVADTGIGISDEEKRKLFKEFSQVDSTISRKYGGTGLGLSICFKIVELLKGDIGVDSVKGQGSTFWFEIPVRVSDHDPLYEEEKQKTYEVTQPLRILLVDDNDINQKVAAGLLQRLKHIVTVAGNGQEAIEQVKAGDFDLILMDMQMPVMDGLEATQRIKALGGKAAAIPIIALTANAMKSDNEKCLAAGMVDHIAKPINPKDLYDKIARHAPESARIDDSEKAPPAEAYNPANREILDTASLQQLESFLGRDYVMNLLDETLDLFPQYIKRIQDNARDSETLFLVAHDLKGLSATLGLMAFSALAEAIERNCGNGKLDEAQSLIAQLPLRYHESLRVLRQIYPAGPRTKTPENA
jgi:TMAO reductase system sensor TorS